MVPELHPGCEGQHNGELQINFDHLGFLNVQLNLKCIGVFALHYEW